MISSLSLFLSLPFPSLHWVVFLLSWNFFLLSLSYLASFVSIQPLSLIKNTRTRFYFGHRSSQNCTHPTRAFIVVSFKRTARVERKVWTCVTIKERKSNDWQMLMLVSLYPCVSSKRYTTDTYRHTLTHTYKHTNSRSWYTNPTWPLVHSLDSLILFLFFFFSHLLSLELFYSLLSLSLVSCFRAIVSVWPVSTNELDSWNHILGEA